MKYFIGIFLFLVSCCLLAAEPPTPAAPFKLTFDRLPLTQFVNVVYGDMLKENFVVHPDLADNSQLVTLEFQQPVSRKELKEFMVSFLAGLGIDAKEKAGYVLLSPVDKTLLNSDNDVYLYRPKYRSVAYITDLISSLFPAGRFSIQRAVRASAVSGVSPLKTPDSGNSAQSQQDRGDVDSFIYSGTAKEITLLKNLLNQVDIQVGEVLVKGVVYEVTTTGSEGSAFTLASSILGQHFGVNIGSPVSGDSFSITTPNFSAVLGLLNQDSHFKSINNATMRVKSGATGLLTVGSDVPILGSVTVTGGGVSQQSVTYQSSGVIFNISPTVFDSSIDLNIDEQVSSFAKTTTGVNGSPTLIKRQMKTTVGSKFDDLIVLGGLDQDNKTNTSANASFLPDFMRSNSSDGTKTELLLILSVHKI